MNLEDEDLQICARDRNKVSSNSHKVGFREGAEAGKDLVFQESFDCGFQEGFKIGCQLGKYLGVVTLLQSNNIKLPEYLRTVDTTGAELIKPTHGCCLICNEGHNDKPFKELLEKQHEESSKYLSEIYDNYKILDKKCLKLAKDITDEIL